MPTDDRSDAPDLDAPALINETAAADLLGVDRASLRRWRLSGDAPRSYAYPTGAVRYHRADVIAWREHYVVPPGEVADADGGQ